MSKGSKASINSLKSNLSYKNEDERQNKLNELLQISEADKQHWDVEGEFSRTNGL